MLHHLPGFMNTRLHQSAIMALVGSWGCALNWLFVLYLHESSVPSFFELVAAPGVALIAGLFSSLLGLLLTPLVFLLGATRRQALATMASMLVAMAWQHALAHSPFFALWGSIAVSVLILSMTILIKNKPSTSEQAKDTRP